MELDRLRINVVTSKVSFSLKKLGFIPIKGELSGLTGKVHFDKTNLRGSSFDVTLNTSTVHTNNKQRDEHLRKEDFFFVTTYPLIAFKSSSVHEENGIFLAKGNLSLLDTTKEIQIPFTFKDGVFKGECSLNRLDYGLGKKFPTFFIGQTVQIFIHCETEL